MGALSSFFSDIASLLFPCRCLVCDKVIRKAYLCHACIPELPMRSTVGYCRKCGTILTQQNKSAICDTCTHIALPFRRILWIWEYQGAARDMITKAKYKPSPALCNYLADQLANSIMSSFSPWDWDLLVPVPSSRKSLQFRTFNQSQILAERILKKLRPYQNVKIDFDSLCYTGKQTPQASLAPDERIKNVRKRFVVSGTGIRDRRVLLVDDVLTTGATASAAAISLLCVGARSVDLAVLARSSTWAEYRQKISEAFKTRLIMAGHES